MPSKSLGAGGEVDSYCTKCRLVLNHRVIAMVGQKPRKVECSTCGSHHLYRPLAPGAKAEPVERASRAGTREPRASKALSATRARALSESRNRSWEQAVLGKSLKDFTHYTVKATFRQGELVHHAKFGEGVVTRIVDVAKVEIAFRDETRMLAQNLTV